MSGGSARQKQAYRQQLARERKALNGDPRERVDRQLEACVAAIAEQSRRAALQPISLTAAICGDPLPGYSALDRKGMGLS